MSNDTSRDPASELVKRVLKREGRRQEDVAKMLDIGASHFSRVLSGARGVVWGDDLKIRLLRNWKAIGFSTSEMRCLQQIPQWIEAGKLAKRRVRIACPAMLFTGVLLFAKSKGYFERNPYAPDAFFEVVWRSHGDALLTGGTTAEAVIDGTAEFGLSHEKRFADDRDKDLSLIPILSLGQAMETRICVPRDMWNCVSDKRKGPPAFLDLVKKLRMSKGGIFFDKSTVGEKFVKCVWERLRLDASDFRGLLRPVGDFHGEIVSGRWPTDKELKCCMVITWPPYTFPLAWKYNATFVDLGEPYYGQSKEDDYRPCLDRNVRSEDDFYRAASQFPVSGTIFARRDYARENPMDCVAVHDALIRACADFQRLYDHAWVGDDGGCVATVEADFRAMLGKSVDNGLSRLLTSCIKAEFGRLRPYVEDRGGMYEAMALEARRLSL